MAFILSLLEEVDELLAGLLAEPDLPFAHLAPRQAALARHALETELVDTGGSNDVSNIRPLQVLRTIARTRDVISLKAAIELGDKWLVWLIVESGAIIDGETFHYACTHGLTEIVRLFIELPLERGVNPAANNNHAIRWACSNGYTEIVRLLLELPLERGVNPASGNNSRVLQFACAKG